MKHSTMLLWAELAIICVILPLVLSMFPLRNTLFASLWLVMAYALIVQSRMDGARITFPSFQWHSLKNRTALKPILYRFAISALLLLAVTWAFLPEALFSFPRQRPILWVAVMFLYPLLSVIPQEIVFRSFFFNRYQALFANPHTMVIASALSFGVAHILLKNWVAVVLSAIGGYFFANTYQKHRSLGLAWAEHALYGCFVFTIGLGAFFYSGAPHKW